MCLLLITWEISIQCNRKFGTGCVTTAMAWWCSAYGLSTLVSETGDFVSGNKWFCCRKRQQSRLFPDTKLPVLATKLPVIGYKFAVSDNEVAWNGNKVACFWIQSCRLKQQNHLFLDTKLSFSGTSVDSPLGRRTFDQQLVSSIPGHALSGQYSDGWPSAGWWTISVYNHHLGQLSLLG